MEEDGIKGDLKGNLPRKLGVRTYTGGLKSSFSGRSSPRGSPSVRRSYSDRTPRREPKAFASEFRWIKSNRIFLWLMLILLWAYIGFHVQSRWAHGEHRWKEFISRKSKDGKKPAGFVQSHSNTSATKGVILTEGKDAKSWNSNSSRSRELSEDVPKQNSKKKSSKKSKRRVKKPSAKSKDVVLENQTSVLEEGLISRRNTSYGLIVGPFGKLEDSILEWNVGKRRGTCDRNGEFARIVWSRTFVLIFHELSMTGAPLSMMELATEILSCGGSVSAVVLSRKGGLITELDGRGIKVLDDKAQLSFKTAMKSDLVIAGSAVCSSWIEQYLAHNPAGSSQIVWWIMENRREYFDRSKNLLSRVKMLVFLTELQSKQWQTWCDEEKIHLNLPPTVVPLSVNDELAFVAGIPCSLNTPSFSAEKMLEKRNLLRAAVRKEMGLSDNDMLVMSLSSINPPKGQRLFLESAVLVAEHNISLKGFEANYTLIANTVLAISQQNETSARIELNHGDDNSKGNRTNILPGKATKATTKKKRKKHSKSSNNLSMENQNSKSTEHDGAMGLRKVLSVNETEKDQNLKVLIGSLGSKSNKPLYLKAMLRLVSQRPHLSKLVFWTPATTRVASLYAAADVYVINAQGLGETFGRVTVEAMAFGLPVLGTDAGGTKEIVENNVTGLLHPVGREGIEVLARNILYFMGNPAIRKQMGMLGRRKVEKKYLKTHMYERFSKVVTKCMKIK